MDKQDNDVLAFFSLEDFINHVGAESGVRVEGICKTVPSGAQIGPLVQWWIIVTAWRNDHVALFGVKVGETWQIFAKQELYHEDNVELAEELVKEYLEERGLQVLGGIWNPKVVMDNLVSGSAGLWHFDEGKRLVVNEERNAYSRKK